MISKFAFAPAKLLGPSRNGPLAPVVETMDSAIHRFGVKTGIHFAYFALELGMGFEGIAECINVFIISIPNEKERKKNMRIRNGFE